MSEPRFTKGPWCDDLSDRYDQDRHHITNLDRKLSSMCEIAIVDTGWEGPFEVEQQANLHLILVAPELYAMVEELTHFVEDISGGSVIDVGQRYSLTERANDLLAKARGEHEH